MIRLLHDMVRQVMVLLIPLLLVLAPARAQVVVYQNTTTSLEIEQKPGDTYIWDLYNDSTVNFATVPGNLSLTTAFFTSGNTGPKVNVTWQQAGTYFFKVVARNSTACTNNLKVGKIKVIPVKIDAVISGMTLMGLCQQVKLDASKSIGDIVRYNWTALDQGGAVSNQTGIETQFLLSPSFSGTLPANFRVMLQVTGRSGQTDNDTISIKIDPAPIAGITSTNQPQKDGSMIVDGSVSAGIGLSYKWTTNDGKIIGPVDRPAASLLGAGLYTLEVTDVHGCKSTKTFRFPIELYQIKANPDYARISWAQDTTVVVLANDHSTAGLVPGTVQIVQPPSRGRIRVNADGTITYTPAGRISGHDEFIYRVCDLVNLCDSALVSVDIYDRGFKAPEAFSPNGDGMNDHLVFPGLENYPHSHLHVYTRAGQLVYQSNDYQNDWDGRTVQSSLTNGKLVPTGVYYYILELGGVNRTVKGFVNISY